MSEPIILTHTRDTGNYRVYEGGGTFEAKDGRGQTVLKNVVLGSLGSVYVGHPIAKDIDAYVLVPKKLWDAVQSPAVANAKAAQTAVPKPQAKKGKK